MSNHAAEQGHHNVSYDQRKDFLRMASKASSHGEGRWAHLVGTRSAETSSHSATNLLELGGRCLSSEFRHCFPVLRPATVEELKAETQLSTSELKQY